jgi:hypothetical protein
MDRITNNTKGVGISTLGQDRGKGGIHHGDAR